MMRFAAGFLARTAKAALILAVSAPRGRRSGLFACALFLMLFVAGGAAGGLTPGKALRACTTTTVWITTTVISTVTQTVTGTTTTPTTTAPTTTAPTTTTNSGCTASYSSGTLQSFLNGLPSGAVGCATGTFNESITFQSGNYTLLGPLTINGSTTIADAADNLTLRDVTFTGGSGFSVVDGHGDNDTFDHVTINGGGVRNCLILGSGGGTNAGAYADDFTVQGHSRFYNCGNDNHEHGIYAEFTRRLHVVDSYLYAAGGYGIQLYPEADNSLIEYSVLDGNDTGTGWAANMLYSGEAAGGEYTVAHSSDNNLVTHSLLTFASPGAATQNVASSYPAGAPTPTGNRLDASCVYSPGDATYSFDHTGDVAVTNITAADPGYANQAGRDYTLAAGSPCAGYGPL